MITGAGANGVATPTIKAEDYTTIAGDDRTQIVHPLADNTERTFNVDLSAHAPGTMLVFVNLSAATLRIRAVNGTMFRVGTAESTPQNMGQNSIIGVRMVDVGLALIGHLLLDPQDAAKLLVVDEKTLRQKPFERPVVNLVDHSGVPMSKPYHEQQQGRRS
jgi:hypothetical protein